MLSVRTAKPTTTKKTDRNIHVRVQAALAALKLKPMSLQSVILIFDLPEATARRLIRETDAMRGRS